jgi:hypothetical protein
MLRATISPYIYFYLISLSRRILNDRRSVFSIRWVGGRKPGEVAESGWEEVLDQEGLREFLVG